MKIQIFYLFFLINVNLPPHLPHLYFKYLLAAVGGNRYTPDIGLRRRQNRNYIYECKNCHFQYPRVRKVNTKKYRCGKIRI